MLFSYWNAKFVEWVFSVLSESMLTLPQVYRLWPVVVGEMNKWQNDKEIGRHWEIQVADFALD